MTKCILIRMEEKSERLEKCLRYVLGTFYCMGAPLNDNVLQFNTLFSLTMLRSLFTLLAEPKFSIS